MTKWFARAARKDGVSRAELCRAAKALNNGQGDDLGGGVWKKRLLENRLRSIVLVQGPRGWIFTYLFAKADRENISPSELEEFRKLARVYAGFGDVDIATALESGAMIEVMCG